MDDATTCSRVACGTTGVFCLKSPLAICKLASNDDLADVDGDEDTGAAAHTGAATLHAQLCQSTELRHHLLVYTDRSLLCSEGKPVCLVPSTSFDTHHVALTDKDVKMLIESRAAASTCQLLDLFNPSAPSLMRMLAQFGGCKLAGIMVNPSRVCFFCSSSWCTGRLLCLPMTRPVGRLSHRRRLAVPPAPPRRLVWGVAWTPPVRLESRA